MGGGEFNLAGGREKGRKEGLRDFLCLVSRLTRTTVGDPELVLSFKNCIFLPPSQGAVVLASHSRDPLPYLNLLSYRFSFSNVE